MSNHLQHIDPTQLDTDIDNIWLTGGGNTKAAPIRSFMKGLVQAVADEFGEIDLAQLTDVSADLSAAADGDVLKYNSSTGSVDLLTPPWISDLSSFTTDDLSEGSGNLYFNNARAISALNGQDISMFNNDAGYLTQGNARVDQTQQSLYTAEWNVTEWIDTTLFSQAASKQVSSTDPESLIADQGAGTTDLPENFLVPGKKLELRARGTLGISSGETLTIYASIGGQQVGTGASFGPPSPTGQNWEAEVDFVARDGGVVYVSGFVRIIDENGEENVAQIPVGTVNVNFADPLSVDLLAQLSLGDDQITSEILTLSKKA